LWIQALAYFARKEENCKPQIVEVLNNILANHLVDQKLASCNYSNSIQLAKIQNVILPSINLCLVTFDVDNLTR